MTMSPPAGEEESVVTASVGAVGVTMREFPVTLNGNALLVVPFDMIVTLYVPDATIMAN